MEMVSTISSQQEDSQLKSQLGPFCGLPMHMWVVSGYSDFLTQSKSMQLRLIGDSKPIIGVSVSVRGYFSLCWLCWL